MSEHNVNGGEVRTRLNPPEDFSKTLHTILSVPQYHWRDIPITITNDEGQARTTTAGRVWDLIGPDEPKRTGVPVWVTMLLTGLLIIVTIALAAKA